MPNRIPRRSILGAFGTTALASQVPLATATSVESPRVDGDKITDAAVETAVHPDKDIIAFTSPHLGDGFQVYLQRSASSPTDELNDPQQLTDAEAGVHGLEWKESARLWQPGLSYSKDGSTYVSVLTGENDTTTFKISDDIKSVEPLWYQEEGIRAAKRNCHKKVDTRVAGVWCINARGGYPSREKCTDGPNSGDHTPLIDVWKFEVVPSRGANDGVSFYYGQEVNGNCTWIGEENYSEKCWNHCPNSGDGVPGLSWLVDKIERAIKASTEAAGIVLPATAVTLIAYTIATGMILAPPTGTPV